jgi:hypothetical protein
VPLCKRRQAQHKKIRKQYFEVRVFFSFLFFGMVFDFLGVVVVVNFFSYLLYVSPSGSEQKRRVFLFSFWVVVGSAIRFDFLLSKVPA